MKLINEQAIIDQWSPVIKSKTNVLNEEKVNWLSKYCHFHKLNENVYNNGYSVLSQLNGIGPVAFPANPNGTGTPFYNGATGSGDKFPSLLPLAIQVAARTIGFDIVNVIPMNSPAGVLPYLDYVYADGKINSAVDKAIMIKVNIQLTGSVGFVKGTTYFVKVDDSAANNSVIKLIYVGKSRIDGYSIFRVFDGNSATSSSVAIADAFNSTSTYELYAADGGTSATPLAIESDGTALSGNQLRKTAELVRALEDHIFGPTGAGPDDTDTWSGHFTDPNYPESPMDRSTGETTYYRTMNIKTYTKAVEAKTYQIAATITTEQIQDLSKQYGIDLVSMVENALVNDISQAINKHILTRGFSLGVTNAVQFSKVELGQQGSGVTGLNIDLTQTSGTPATVTAKDSYGNNVTMSYANMSVVASNNAENYLTVSRRLYSRIMAAANIISNRGGRGPANFVVTNSQLATAMQDISQFTPAPFTNTINQNNGSLYPVGTISGMTVYVDPNMQWNDSRILVGRKGADDEPGLKFMPYLMAESIQTISEGTMSPKIAVKSRYALVEAGQLPQTYYFTLFVKTNGNILG